MADNVYKLPVRQGYRCYASAGFAYKNFKHGKLKALIEDADGNVLFEHSWAGGSEYTTGSMAFSIVGGLFDVINANAAFVQLVFIGVGNGSANGKLFVDNIAMGAVSSTQEALPNYTIGRPDPYADNTATSSVFIAAQETIAAQQIIIDESITIVNSTVAQVDFTDGVISTALPIEVSFNAFLGATPIDSEGVYSIHEIASGITAEILTDTNIMYITDVENAGDITVRFERNGKTYDRVVSVVVNNIYTTPPAPADFDFPNIEGYYQMGTSYEVNKTLPGASGLNAIEFAFVKNTSVFDYDRGWSMISPIAIQINNQPLDMINSSEEYYPDQHYEYSLKDASKTINLVSGSNVKIAYDVNIDPITFDGILSTSGGSADPTGVLLGTLTITNNTTSTLLDTVNIYG